MTAAEQAAQHADELYNLIPLLVPGAHAKAIRAALVELVSGLERDAEACDGIHRRDLAKIAELIFQREAAEDRVRELEAAANWSDGIPDAVERAFDYVPLSQYDEVRKLAEYSLSALLARVRELTAALEQIADHSVHTSSMQIARAALAAAGEPGEEQRGWTEGMNSGEPDDTVMPYPPDSQVLDVTDPADPKFAVPHFEHTDDP